MRRLPVTVTVALIVLFVVYAIGLRFGVGGDYIHLLLLLMAGLVLLECVPRWLLAPGGAGASP